MLVFIETLPRSPGAVLEPIMLLKHLEFSQPLRKHHHTLRSAIWIECIFIMIYHSCSVFMSESYISSHYNLHGMVLISCLRLICNPMYFSKSILPTQYSIFILIIACFILILFHLAIIFCETNTGGCNESDVLSFYSLFSFSLFIYFLLRRS